MCSGDRQILSPSHTQAHGTRHPRGRIATAPFARRRGASCEMRGASPGPGSTFCAFLQRPFHATLGRFTRKIRWTGGQSGRPDNPFQSGCLSWTRKILHDSGWGRVGLSQVFVVCVLLGHRQLRLRTRFSFWIAAHRSYHDFGCTGAFAFG